MIRNRGFLAIAAALIVLGLIGAGWLLVTDRGKTRTAALPPADSSVSPPRIDQPKAAPQPNNDPLRNALNRAAAGDLDGALAEIEILHKVQPDAPGPYLGLAEIAVRKGDIEAADAWLSEGLSVAPNVSEFYRARARLLLLQKKDAEAVATFDKAVELAPNDPRIRLEIADLYATRLNEPTKSVDYFKAALALDPGNAPAYYGLGVVLARLDRLDEAKTALAQARQLAPNNPLPLLVMGQVSVREKRYQDALDAFDEALTVQPTLVVARIARGDVLQGIQKYSDAIAEYQLALRASPKSVPALLGLAMAQQEGGFVEDAQKSYREVIAINANHPVALNNLAWLASTQKGNLDEALGWAKQAVALADGQAEFHDTLGWVYYSRGELAEASAELERALQLQPVAATYTHLGLVRAAQGQKEAAAEAFRNALAITPDFEPALEGLRTLQ